MIWIYVVLFLILLYMGGKSMGYPKDRCVGIDEVSRPAKKAPAKKKAAAKKKK